jgi:drug/metabolite transporter (DMT)-like permease
MMATPSRLRIILAFAAVYLIWGSTYLGIRFAIASMPPFLMAGTRFLLSGIIMYAIARMSGAAKPAASTWKPALIIGACLISAGNGGVTIAERWVPSSLAALLVATVPIYIALLSWISGTASRPPGMVWAGLFGGFVGVGILVGPEFVAPAGHRYVAFGMSILLVSSLLWSIGSLYSRNAKNASSPFLAAGQQMICGGLVLILIGGVTAEYRGFQPSNVTAASLIAFAYLVIVAGLFGFPAYVFLLRHCDPAKVATYAYVNPVVAVILGAVFAREVLTARTLVGAALIIGAVAVVIMAQQFTSAKSLHPVGAVPASRIKQGEDAAAPTVR